MKKIKKLKKAIIVNPIISWEEIQERFFARHKRRNHSPLTITKYRFVIEEYFAFCKSKVSEKSLNEYKNLLTLENFEAVTINKYISILKTFFNWSEKQEYIQTNPGDNIEFLEKKKRLPVVIREAQMQKLFDDMEKDPTQRVQDVLMFEVFYGSGIRTNELCHVKISEVDLIKATLKITEGKGGKERVVAFPPTMLPRLKNYLSGLNRMFPMNNYLFPNRMGNRMGAATAYRRISSVLGKLLNEKKGAHTLRHSFATVMLERGAPMKAIQMQLGHASMDTTKLYTHNTINRLRDVHKKSHPRG